MAQYAALRKDYDEAEKWLEPVMEQTKLHFEELAAICQTRIRLELARGRRDAAQSWLDMWAGVEPDHPEIDYWRRQVQGPRWTSRLRGLYKPSRKF
jgi:uncharacterized protein HemY